MINALVTNNWITILFIFLFGLLVIANSFFEKRFLKFKTLFHTKQYFVDYLSITTVSHPFNIIFLIFQISCYAYLSLKIIEYFNESMLKNQFLYFLKIAFVIFVFYLIRYSIGKIIALFFNIKKEQEELSFVKLTHLAKVTLIAFPFLIVFTYLDFRNGFLFIVLAIYLALLLLIKYIILLRQNQKLIFNKLFYFILYLCTLEILPLILVYKTLVVKV